MDYEDFEEPLPPWAIGKSNGELKVGVQLCTKDGRRMGNAVVTGQRTATWAYKDGTVPEIYEVVTDVGNKMRLTTNEVDELFYIGDYVMDVGEALLRRL